ncbi:hypothetical protein BHQ17_00935 [Mycolicibacterium holsaticum]|uniref:Uncharacterized protein n=1 Tax=Mycolicibacterium holsaticum TaxID=152142 RepID=A0A1E3S326_9MYCO|nr:hypothetical protein BHQ17_00935 [Mycolicibacterium holsaticum]
MAAVSLPVLVHPPTAHAEDVVTYEVASDTVTVADIEYQTSTGRMSAGSVALPWRIDTAVRTVDGPPPHGSQVRADWRRDAAPRRWVSVRVIHRGKVICQNTLDIGGAACYGAVRRIT